MTRTKTRVVRRLTALRKQVASWRAAGESVALLPTMGALHRGHLALVKQGQRKADRTVVSIFVNPTQFGAAEDLSRYPRDEAGDLAKLATAGVDLVWAPAVEEMYPEGMATRIVPEGAALPLEGAFRPHHFAGVATVCCKLFGQVTPDVALFGEKDYQQLCVIRQMVRDLNLPLKIIGVPTVREKDGLALSSRNAYLTPEERKVASELHRALLDAATRIAKGDKTTDVTASAKKQLLAAGFTKVDYVEVGDAETLAPFDSKSGRPGRVLAAAWLGRTRLIDNVGVSAVASTVR